MRQYLKLVVRVIKRDIIASYSDGAKDYYQCKHYSILNLLNMNQGRHTQEILIYDEVAPIYDVEILLRKVYKNVTMPLGEEFECETGADFTKISLKRFDVHSIILLED